MAKKYWWEEDEEQTTTQSQSRTQNQPEQQAQKKTEKKYWWESDATQSSGKSFWWDDDGSTISAIGNEVTTKVNNWLNSYNSYISGYQNRYSSRKGNYEDAYVSDSSDWLNTVTQRKSELDTEADAIISYLDQYKDYLDADWVSKVKTSLSKAKSGSNRVIEGAKQDNDYWSKFAPNEEQAAAGYTAEKIYNEWQTGQKQYAEDLVFDVSAGELELEELKKEKDAWIADQQEKRKQAQENETWLEKIIRWSGNSPDTTLPIVGSGGYSSDTISTGQYDKLIAEKEAQIERAKYAQGYEGYMGNMNAEDYAANSQYVSTRTDVAMDDALWGLYNDQYDTSKLFGDYLYDYINRNQDALDAATVNDTATNATFYGFDKNFLQTMSDEEIGVYNYLYKTQGQESANEYLSFIESDLEGRKRVQEQAEWAAYAKESPFGSSVFSTLISPLKGLSYLGQAADMLDDGKMDENAGYNRFSYIPSSIRSQVSSTIEKSGKWGKVGSFAYNTGMSMADFLFTTAVSGGNQGLSLAIMGSGAAADATLAAKDRGLDDGQAFALGTIAGMAEVAMERISLGAWLNGDMTEGALRYVLKNALSEGGEEAGTSIANLLADIIIAGDKSEWNMAIQNYIAQGKSEEEAFGLVLAENAAQIGLDALGGILSGAAIGGGTYAGTSIASKFEYGQIAKDKAEAQQLVTEGLEYNPDSQYIQKAQSKLEKGKNLTGMQVRNILAANQESITKSDMQKIQAAAEQRLTALGQTEDVAEIARIATKRATGQDLTRAEKTKLANSKYGARVANELLPENIASDDYSTAWAAEIGTKRVNATAYNIRSIIDEMTNKGKYTSLESRLEGETEAKVSDTGKAVIQGTDEDIDLAKPTFKQIADDGVVLLVNGKDVRADEIDYESASQELAIRGVGKIENVTPEAAGAIYSMIDMDKSVMKQLNGLDEAFTFGYYNYSEADLNAGEFTSDLTDKQKKDAYDLGKYIAKNRDDSKADSFKIMRTAAQAEVEKAKAEGKDVSGAKNLTITYNKGNGEVVSIDEANLNDTQSGGVEWAKILHKMGLGTKVEFFKSELSDTIKVKDKKTGELKKARVFINDQGLEQIAYSGLYRKSDGTIRIDLNAYSGRGFTLNALAHELTHFIQKWSDKKYKVLVDFLMKEYEKTDMTMHERVVSEQKRLQEIRGEEVSYDEAYDEVVANAMNKMFDDGNMAEKLAKLKEQDKNLAQKLWEGFKEILAKFIGIYEKEGLFRDANVLVEMKDTFDQLQNMFAEALVEASENYQASLIAKEAGIEIMPVEDGTMYSYSSLAEAAGFEAVENEDGTRSFVREGKKVSKVTIADIDNSPIGAFINFSLEMGDISEADAKRQKQMFADICTMACKTNDFAMTMQFVGSAVFTGMKANADKQYGTTYDFPSICTKTQAVIDAMSAKMMKLGRGLTSDEIVQLYEDVFASGNPVPCPECYVFSRWIGIGGLLDNIKKYQDYYGDMDVKDVADAYLKMKAEVSKFAEEQGISFGKAKGALTSKLTKEFNKLTEKIEKNENQGENVKASDRQRLAELEPMMNTVKSMTWLENVYFADSSLKKVNPNFRVPDSVLFDLNNGEAFATKYKEAWAFRTTQGAGYGKAITPYAEARLGEGVLVTNNTTNAIKGKAQGSLNNYFLNQMGKLDKQSRDALKRSRLKQKIQAFLGGQRFQSTSDARYENASDYLLAALEMQAMRGMVQCYTKVDGAVPAFSAWGFSINQSLMPLNGGLDANGNVKDTSVGGMKPSVAFENRNKHESAGTITIGVNDNHIRAMFKQWVRDFIIPYHASGGKADVVAAFRSIQEGKEAKGKAVRSTDYSRTQSDKVLSDDVLRWQGKTDAQIQRIHEIRNARIAILTGGKPNMTVVRSNRFLSALYDKFNGGEWDGVKVAKSKVESQIYPNEFWDQTVTYEESAKITKDYLEYCEDLGFLHRFSGMVPSNGKLVPVNGYNENGERVQLTDLAYKYDADGNKTTEVEEFFWKVLTDRRMYDNNGNYLAQKIVTLNDTTTDTVTGFAKNNQGREYDKAKAEALAQKIVKEHSGDRFSLHDPVESTNDLVAFHNISEKLLWDALKQKGLVMPSLAVTNKGLDAFGEISLLFDKSVIDPAVNKDNKLYGADAWTPMQTTLKMNAKFDTNKTVNAVNTMKDHIGSKYVSELLNITPKQFKEAIIKADGNIYEAYAHDIGVQTAYAMEKGIISQIPTNKDGTVNQEMLQKQLDKTLDTDEGWRQYRRWLNNISDTVITSYDQATNEDVLRHMKSQPATAKSFKLSETGELVVPAVEYSSIKELRRNKNRLSENAEEATKAVAAEFLAFAQKIGDTQQVVEAINAGFEGRYNIADIMKAFSNKGIKLSSKEAGDLQALYKKAVELPTQYFEAKPGGEVGLDKVNTAVVPDNVSAELRQALEEQGINVIEYKQGSKESRTKAVNSVEELRFSSQETDADNAPIDTSEIDENAKAIIKNLEIRAMASRYRKGAYASYSTERIEREIERSSATKLDYAKSYIAWVEPIDFLYATTTSAEGRAQIEKEAGALDLERLRKQTQPIHLTVDFETGKIVGHEGRHRMIALHKAGVEKVAVVFDAWNDDRYNTKPVDMMMIGGQEFGRYSSGLDFFAHDMLPLSKRYADAARKLFSETEGSLRFSEHETDYSNRSLLANAFEGITKDSIEYKMIQDYKGHIGVLNMLDKRLSVLNEQIRDIRFTKGKYDAEKLKELENERKDVIKEINRYDKMLLNLEASEPLRKVIQRERKKEAQKTKDHVKEIQQNKKVRAEQAEYRYKIRNFKKKLEAKLLRPTDRQYVPVDLIKAMVEVCEIIDTDTNPYNADGSINKAQAKRDETKEKLQNLKDEYEKLKTHSDPIYAGEFDEMVYAYLTELRDNFSGKSLKEMSVDELAEMYEILRAIDETLADARKLIGWGDAENVYEAGDAIVAEQNAITHKRKHGKRNAAQKGIDKIDNLGLSPVRNVERMSAYNQDSALLKLFKKFEQGIRKKNKFKMDAYKSFEKLTSGKEYDDSIYKEVDGKKYTDVKGRQFGVSKMQMMQAILSWEREQANKNLHHIENGGFTFADLGKLRKGNLKDAVSAENSHRVPNAVGLVAEFQEALKDDKWCQDYMAAARSFFNGMAKDAINETSIELKHRIIAKDKNYIPFEVDTNFVNTEITDMDAVQQTINSYGMLKDTTNNAPQALYITGLNNILDRHIEQVGTIYGLAIEVRNFNKVWNVRSKDESGNDPTVKESIDTNWGKEGVKHIEQAVKDIQGSRVRERSALYDKVKSNYISSTFLLNLSVVTKQIGSLFSATSMLKWRNPAKMIGNLIYTMANHKKISAEVDKYTATAWMRRQGMSDAELYTLMTQAKKPGLHKLMSKLPAVFNPTKWITAMDHAVALSLWRYAKQDTAKKTGLDGEALLKATAEFYDEVVENTQSMTDVLHRPEIQKSGNVMHETFAMFKTDLFQMAGQLQATAGRYMANKSKENGIALGRTVYSIAMGAIWGQLMTAVFALLRYKVDRYRDDDDEEEKITVESWMKRQGIGLAGDLMGYIFPIFGSEVVGIFESIMYGEPDDFMDNISFTAINDLVDTMIAVGTSIKDGEWPDTAKMRKYAAKVLQVFTPIPVNNILRTLDAIQLHAEDIANGEFFSFNAGVDSKTDDLYDAIVSGNKSAHAKLKASYVDKDGNFSQGKYDSAVVKALQENDPRIHEAAQAGVNGNSEERNRIFKEIKADLGQEYANYIIEAINAEVNKIHNDAKPEKVAGKYEAYDFVAAVSAGDANTAKAVRDDIIATYVANGKTQAEAEKAFVSDVKSGIEEAYSYDLLDQAGAEKMLMEYADMDEEEAASEVSYWAFCNENPKYAKDVSEAKYNKYKEFAEPAGIDLDAFVQYIKGTKGLETIKDEWGDEIKSEREQVLEVIDSLPLTWQQKDALYLAHGLAESKIWDVPW